MLGDGGAVRVRGYYKGYPVIYDYVRNVWLWADSGDPVTLNPRNCMKCNKPPTDKGFDACIGEIDGAIGACCGHGTATGYIQWEGSSYPLGWKRGVYVTAD